MAVELGKAAREILERLPESHSDRRFIEGVLGVVQGYNARARLVGKEAPAEVKRFSPEARQALENQGYFVYELTGQSIRSLREAGGRFWSDWHKDNPEFEALTSRVSEVAFNPSELFLPDSNRKPLSQQEEMVAGYSKELARKISGVEAVIGEAPEYAELYFTHFRATGEHLFGEKYGYNYARTKTSTVGSSVAFVGDVRPVYGLSVYDLHRDYPDDGVFAAPLVVPA